MKKKKAFTLIELLAVIVILAIILVIAVPKILNTIEKSKKGSMESSAKLIARDIETKYQTQLATGTGNIIANTDNVACPDDIQNINEYSSCTYKIDNNGKATVNLVGSSTGKFAGYVCNNVTKTYALCTKDEYAAVCPNGVEQTYDYVLKDLSEDEVTSCISDLTDLFIEAGGEEPWSEEYAEALCTADDSYSITNAIFEDINYKIYTYDNISKYFNRYILCK